MNEGDRTPIGPRPLRRRLLIAAAGCGLGFVLLAVAVGRRWGWLVGFDRSWSSRAFAFTQAHAWWESFARAVTWLGSTAAVILVTALGCLACVLGRRSLVAVWLAVTVEGSSLLNSLVKSEVQRIRPPSAGAVVEAHGFAFPSGHTQAATVTYVAVVLVAGWQLLRPPRRLRVVSAGVVVGVAGAVGWSRVFLGVHWPSDVLGGWLLGSAWVTASTAVLLTLAARRGGRSG